MADGEGATPETTTSDEGATPESQGSESPPQQEQTQDEVLGDAGKKALAAEREARKKAQAELDALRKETQELRRKAKSSDDGDAQLTELTQRLEALEQEKTAAERQAMVLKVASEVGIPAELAGRLQGDTEEAIRADAADLAGLVKQPPAAPAAGGNRGPAKDSRTPQEWIEVLRSRR